MTTDQYPLLIDQYLTDAIEIDVDAVSDGADVVVAGIMEHVEEAGIHSGDSACSLPPHSLTSGLIDRIRTETVALARELQVIGLMNVQFAIQGNEVFILEVNPRASRTVPFVSKTIGVPLAKLAMKVMVGHSLRALNFTTVPVARHIAVKESVFPFTKLGNVDVLLGPEMRSTGEVMGIDQDFGWAFAKVPGGGGPEPALYGHDHHEREKRRQTRDGGRRRTVAGVGVQTPGHTRNRRVFARTRPQRGTRQ